MKLFLWIIMTLYLILFILMGLGLMAFALHWVPLERALWFLEAVYNDERLRAWCLVTGAGLVLLNWVVAQLSLARAQRQKTIAFENPDGQVTVSLSAIEDFIRRSTQEMEEVKDLRCDVVAAKGKIWVRCRVTLWSEAHIPEATERLQALVKSRVQEMLSGVEEPVAVKVHVAKISHRHEKESKSSKKDETLAPPFRGFDYGGGDVR